MVRHSRNSYDRRRTRKARGATAVIWLVGVALAVNAVVLPSVAYGVGAVLMAPAGVALLVSDHVREDVIARRNLPAYGLEAVWLLVAVGLAAAGLAVVALGS